jgi:hypothetical protein
MKNADSEEEEMDGVSLLSALIDMQNARRGLPVRLDDDLRIAIARAEAEGLLRRPAQDPLTARLARRLERLAARVRGEVARLGITHV